VSNKPSSTLFVAFPVFIVADLLVDILISLSGMPLPIYIRLLLSAYFAIGASWVVSDLKLEKFFGLKLSHQAFVLLLTVAWPWRKSIAGYE